MDIALGLSFERGRNSFGGGFGDVGVSFRGCGEGWFGGGSGFFLGYFFYPVIVLEDNGIFFRFAFTGKMAAIGNVAGDVGNKVDFETFAG